MQQPNSIPPKPPSKRAQTIFCRVVIEGRTAEAVARDYEIQPVQIQRIVRQVKRWMRLTPRGITEEAELVSAETLRELHVARLEHQWEQTMFAWYRSTQAEEIEKVVGEDGGKRKAEKTRRSQTGDVKYLQWARELMAEIRSLTAANRVVTNNQESEHVESLTLEQREAALDHLLQTLDQRARAAENGGTAAGENAAA